MAKKKTSVVKEGTKLVENIEQINASESSPETKKQSKLAKQEKNPEIKKETASAQCKDRKCAAHGGVKLHGRVFVGRVVSDKMHGTVNVEWPRVLYVPKYERQEKRRTRVKAHNPACLAVKAGELVKIAECRPLAKTVNFVVIGRVR